MPVAAAVRSGQRDSEDGIRPSGFSGFLYVPDHHALQRPRELENLEVLTPEQAEEWEAMRTVVRTGPDHRFGRWSRYPRRHLLNEFWYERGSETIADRRTSLIYDPPNGRIPA